MSSVFGSPRGWLAGSPTVPRDKQRRTMDSLFVMAYHGNLLEYHLEPHPAASIPQDKVTEDSPIELEASCHIFFWIIELQYCIIIKYLQILFNLIMIDIKKKGTGKLGTLREE